MRIITVVVHVICNIIVKVTICSPLVFFLRGKIENDDKKKAFFKKKIVLQILFIFNVRTYISVNKIIIKQKNCLM